MALGALIAAYQEDDQGGLRALLPLAGQTLLEYQVRCAAAIEADPIIVLVERIPPILNEAFDRLRADGISLIPVSDARDAASRFEPSRMVLLLGDGIVPTPDMIGQFAAEQEPAIATVPDDPEHEAFERVDAHARWAGVAMVEGHLLASTAAMLGDWDLQSTLLRRALQDGATRIPLDSETGEPLLVDGADQLAGFEQAMIAASRGNRRDFASRYLLAPLEDLATTQLMERPVRPEWLIWAALALTIAGSGAFLKGWPAIAIVLLLISAPLDLIAARLATLRLRPLAATMMSRRLLWPAAGIALLALGWSTMNAGSGWGALMAALSTIAFAEAGRIESPRIAVPGEIWLFSRRNAILLGIPFAVFGAWSSYLGAMAFYAASSFFLLQNLQHRAKSELTRD